MVTAPFGKSQTLRKALAFPKKPGWVLAGPGQIPVDRDRPAPSGWCAANPHWLNCWVEPDGTLMVRLAGFEPATCCSGGNRSIHLSYRRILFKVNQLTKTQNLQSPSIVGKVVGMPHNASPSATSTSCTWNCFASSMYFSSFSAAETFAARAG